MYLGKKGKICYKKNRFTGRIWSMVRDNEVWLPSLNTSYYCIYKVTWQTSQQIYTGNKKNVKMSSSLNVAQVFTHIRRQGSPP
jgi:hypothetical protein